MFEPDLYKILRAAQLSMHHAAAGEEHLSYYYDAWIVRHLSEILYEDLWAATAPTSAFPAHRYISQQHPATPGSGGHPATFSA